MPTRPAALRLSGSLGTATLSISNAALGMGRFFLRLDSPIASAKTAPGHNSRMSSKRAHPRSAKAKGHKLDDGNQSECWFRYIVQAGNAHGAEYAPSRPIRLRPENSN